MIKYMLIMCIFFISIYIFLVFWAIKIKGFKYSEIDLNTNKIISISEFIYVLESKVRYFILLDDGKVKYIDRKDIQFYLTKGKVFREIFSLKDGLTIKKEVIPTK